MFIKISGNNTASMISAALGNWQGNQLQRQRVPVLWQQTLLPVCPERSLKLRDWRAPKLSRRFGVQQRRRFGVWRRNIWWSVGQEGQLQTSGGHREASGGGKRKPDKKLPLQWILTASKLYFWRRMLKLTAQKIFLLLVIV